jgi:hypothetical protein
MKKLALLSALVGLLISYGAVFAELEWADPALCVNGKWLLIDSANASAIDVLVPKGAAYGDQVAGRCHTPAPAPLLPLDRVRAKGGHDDGVRVRIDGRNASPMVTVKYGDASHTESNHGQMMWFNFR